MKKKRSVINDAAYRLFSNYGYKRVTMDDVAKEAGVTKKTVYDYYKNKNDLLLQLILNELQIMKQIITDIEQEQLSYFKTIHRTIYELLKYKKKQQLLVVLGDEVKRTNREELRHIIYTFDLSIKTYIHDKLSQAVAEGNIKPCNVDVMAFLVYKMYVSLLFEWDLEKEPIDEKELSDNLIHILTTGLFSEREDENNE